MRRSGAAARVAAWPVLLLVLSVPGPGAHADTRGADLLPWRIERDIQRFRFSGTDEVMDLLAIRPGMTILDIGAGTGQFAYAFSKRLNGTGAVYATDTQAYCVDHMRKEAEIRGLDNLHPVLVRRDGLDEFYGKRKYDLVTVFHVAMAYEEQVGYFRELRGILAEGGRLVLILQKIPTPFSPADLTGDPREWIRDLSREPADSPYYGLLKDSTRTRIRGDSGRDPPEELKHAIVGDFNEALRSGPRFFRNFLDGSAFRRDTGLTPEERAFADFLLLSVPGGNFANRNAYRRDGGTQAVETADNPKLQEAAMFLNKLLILQKYRRFLRTDGLFLSGFTPPIRAVFEKAGYRVVRIYPDVIPLEDIVVLSAR